MPNQRTATRIATLLGVCIVALLLNGCKLLFPPSITTYALHLDSANAKEGDKALTGTVWLQGFEITEGFNTEKFVYRDSATQRLKMSKHLEWAGMAPDVLGDLVFRYLSRRFPGHIQLSMTPPADYIVECRVQDMAIQRKGTRSPQSISLEVYYQIKKKTGQSYSNVVLVTECHPEPVTAQRKEYVANAMATAIQKIAEHIGDSLVSVARRTPPAGATAQVHSLLDTTRSKTSSPGATRVLFAVDDASSSMNQKEFVVREKGGTIRIETGHRWYDIPSEMIELYLEDRLSSNSDFGVVHSSSPPPDYLLELTVRDFVVSAIPQGKESWYSTSVVIDVTKKHYDKERQRFQLSSVRTIRPEPGGTVGASDSELYERLVESFRHQLDSVSRDIMNDLGAHGKQGKKSQKAGGTKGTPQSGELQKQRKQGS